VNDANFFRSRKLRSPIRREEQVFASGIVCTKVRIDTFVQ